ncbi:YceI family protein [Fulvivirga sediminis]|uniref:YceI family protein n=1 Tax=Fulvivirga sediminis TaxID=2803949 RepID=A0A937K2R0_9BACT|nr:YceI family protein [Fulvivirga sediminis]MBL3658871.1 YceI family protein [Fulvivirga sediminis]
MKNILFFLGFSLIMSGASYAQTTWIIDPSHSSIQFEVPHMTVSSVTGTFTSYAGTLTSKSKQEFDGAKITTTIEVNSITTNNMERDKNLKDEDFFNAAKYPEIKFESTSFTNTSGNHYKITGNLTIKGITKEITLLAEFGGIISINNKQKAGFKATATINRFNYGLQWNDVLDNGGLIVGEKVDIIINAELLKQ